jgi:pimeloyl-ACP methyl ester carboxylesterase
MGKGASDFDATFGNVASQIDYQRVRIPALVLYGLRSPSSTLRISELLGNALPMAEMRGFSQMGHMGPVTHPADVNRRIMQFLNWHEATDAAARSSRVA